MSFQIFAISERSKIWKQIAGKSLKATRWKNFESFLKVKELAKFWKQIAGKFLKANRWKNFESFLKANRWKMFESFLNARPYCFCNVCDTPRTNNSAFARENHETYKWRQVTKRSTLILYIDAGQKKNVILPTRYLCSC